jgi:hypothetical protein
MALGRNNAVSWHVRQCVVMCLFPCIIFVDPIVYRLGHDEVMRYKVLRNFSDRWHRRDSGWNSNKGRCNSQKEDEWKGVHSENGLPPFY